MTRARGAFVVVAVAMGCGATDTSRVAGTQPPASTGGSGAAMQQGGTGGAAGAAPGGAGGADAPGGKGGGFVAGMSGSSGAVAVGGNSGAGGDGGAASAGTSGMSGAGGMSGMGGMNGGAAGGGATAGGTSGVGGASGGSGGGGGGTSGAAGAVTCPPPDIPGAPEAVVVVPGTNFGFIEVDDATLYWTSYGIQAIPKTSGPIRTIVDDPTGNTWLSMVQPGYLHGVDKNGSLFRVPRDGVNATPEVLLPWTGDDFGPVFSMLGDDIYVGGAQRVSPGATAAVPIDPTHGMVGYWAGGVATDGTSLYWRTEMYKPKSDSNPTSTWGAWIRKLTPPATIPVDFWTQGGAPFEVPLGNVARASDKHLCVNAGGLRCYDLATGKVVAGELAEYVAFRIDEPHLFFASSQPVSSGCRSIFRQSFGGGPNLTLWSSLGHLDGLAIDADYVYWHDTFDNTIYRKHK